MPLNLTETEFDERCIPSLSQHPDKQPSGKPLVRIYNVGDKRNEIWVYWDKETDLHIRQDVLICLVNIEEDRLRQQVGVGLAL